MRGICNALLPGLCCARDVVEPILANRNGGTDVLASEYKVYKCIGEVIRCPGRFRAVPQKIVEPPGRQNAVYGSVGTIWISRVQRRTIRRIPDRGIGRSEARTHRSGRTARHCHLSRLTSAAPVKTACGRAACDFGHREDVARTILRESVR